MATRGVAGAMKPKPAVVPIVAVGGAFLVGAIAALTNMIIPHEMGLITGAVYLSGAYYFRLVSPHRDRCPPAVTLGFLILAIVAFALSIPAWIPSWERQAMSLGFVLLGAVGVAAWYHVAVNVLEDPVDSIADRLPEWFEP